MSTNSTTYVDYNQLIPIKAAWLNDVNTVVYTLLSSNGSVPTSSAGILTTLGGLSTTAAAATYLSIANAASTYLTQANAALTYIPLTAFGTANTWTARQKIVVGTGTADGGLGAVRIESHTDVSGMSWGAAISGWSSTGQALGVFAAGYCSTPGSEGWGGNVLAWSGTPTTPPSSGSGITLCGLETDVISQDDNNSANLVGHTIVFFDRPFGAANPYHGLGSNKYNKGSVGLRFDSQVPSSSGEACCWNKGIAFSANSIGIGNSYRGTALDFTNINLSVADCIVFPDSSILNHSPFANSYTWHHYGVSTTPARAANHFYGPTTYPIEVIVNGISTSATINDAIELLVNATGTYSGGEFGADVVDADTVCYYKDASTVIPKERGATVRAIIPTGAYYAVYTYANAILSTSSSNSWRELKLGSDA